MRHWLICLAGFLAMWVGHGAMGTADSLSGVLTGLVQRANAGGQPAQLSPHLSVLLGLAASEHVTPVKQLGIKIGATLWLFDVCGGTPGALVLMRVGDDHLVTAYRMNAHGQLIKGVSYAIGGETQLLESREAKKGFLVQRDFWIAKERELEAGS